MIDYASPAGAKPRSPVAGNPIDLEHLSRQSMGDPGLEEEVLRLYADMSLVYLARIEASTSQPDLVESLHTLKSAASGIGAFGVGNLAGNAIDALRQGQPVDPERIEDIAIAVTECADYIDRLLTAAA
jgi:HPt (histidine-containing phosphotransfer) domain-containing protein